MQRLIEYGFFSTEAEIAREAIRLITLKLEEENEEI